VIFALLIGLAFGFFGSVPVAGPIAALIVQRGLAGRYRSGVFIALGAAIPEGAFAYLAFWGFSTFLSKYPWIDTVARGAAMVLLLLLAIAFSRQETKPPEVTEKGSDEAHKSFWLGFTITALNPTLIATWTAAATTLASMRDVPLSPREAAVFAVGAVVGIVGWFLSLLGLMRRYRSKFKPESLDRAVRIMGFTLFGLAAYFAWRFVDALLHI
jgi:threonine/homoserine/homoserine lactone efflux protein